MPSLIEAFAWCFSDTRWNGRWRPFRYVLAPEPIPNRYAVWLDVTDPDHPAALCKCGVNLDPPLQLVRHCEAQRAKRMADAIDAMERENFNPEETQ